MILNTQSMVNLTETNSNEINAKLLNDRLIRSVSDVLHREIEEYLSERLKDYSLYKDTYEQIMNISNAHNSSSTTCDQLKKENEELKEELDAYRQLLDINEPHSESENISFSIDENVAPEYDSMVPDVSDITFVDPIAPDVSDIKFVEPNIPRNIDAEAERMSFWKNDLQENPNYQDGNKDNEEEIITGYSDFEIDPYSDEEKTSAE